MDSGVIVSGPAPLLTLREAAAFLRCSPSTLYSTAWRRRTSHPAPHQDRSARPVADRGSRRRAAESGAQRERQEPRSSHARFARNQAGRDSRPNRARSTRRATWLLLHAHGVHGDEQLRTREAALKLLQAVATR